MSGSDRLVHVVVVALDGEGPAADPTAPYRRTVDTVQAQRGVEFVITAVVPDRGVATALQAPGVEAVVDPTGDWTRAVTATPTPFVLVLGAGDEFATMSALRQLRDALDDEPAGPDTRLAAVGDETDPGEDGALHDQRKPTFDPLLAWSTPLYERPVLWPRATLEAVLAALPPAPPPLPLRRLAGGAGTAGVRMVRVPAVLVRRAVTPAQLPAAAAAIADAVGPGTTVTDLGNGLVDVVAPAGPEQRVTVVVPTAGARREIDGVTGRLVARCLDGLLHRTSHPVAEVVAVVSDNAEPGLEAELEALDPRVRAVRVPGPFNFSRSVNVGAVHAGSPWLLLLNDDVEVVDPDWLTRMLAVGGHEGVGVVGAKLLFEDRTLQHAGVVHGGDDLPYHLEMYTPDDDPARPERFQLAVPTVFDGVTGACLLVRTADFDLVGGLSERFPLNYNDIDFCLKLAALGRVSVLEPRATLVHRESSSRVNELLPAESRDYQALWSGLLGVGGLRRWFTGRDERHPSV